MRARWPGAAGEAAPALADRAHRTPQAKTTVPQPTDGCVPRPRCTAALDAAVGAHRLALVCASAGYGKTTLVAAWARARSETTAWASLDVLDDDPRRLAAVLLDALDLAAGARPAAPAPRTTQSLVELVDALVATSSRAAPGTVLVLDDVHRLSVATARQVLGPLIELTAIHLVLVTRHDTAVPLQRFRAAGELGEVRADVLAFTEAEVAELARRLDAPAGPGALHDLWELTDGWPVAVRLAVAAGVLEPSGRPLERLRDRDVPLSGYLVEEVIGTLPTTLAEFVLRASCAEQIDARLADALAPGGALLLEQSVERGLFLTPVDTLDDGAVVYRWHPLVSAHARAVLLRRDPGSARDAHRVVAEHVALDDPAAGIGHALDAGAPELADRILEERWPDLLVRGDTMAVRRLRGALPTPFHDGPEALLAVSAAGAAQDDLELAAARGAGTVGELVLTFLARERPALGASIRQGRRTLARTDLEEATRALGDYLLGRAQMQELESCPDAMPRLTRAERVATERGWTALALACRSEQSLALAREGRHLHAARRSEEVLLQAQAHGWACSAMVASAFLARGISAYWRDELGSARENLDRAIEVSTPVRRETAVQAATLLALVCLAEGDAAGLARARDLTDAPWGDTGVPEHLADVRALLTALQLDVESRTAEALTVLDRHDGTLRVPLALIWQSHARRRTGDRAGAGDALRAARVAITASRASAETVVALHVAEALLLADPDRQHRALEDALDAVWPEQVVRPLSDACPELHPLLSAHLEWGTAHDALVVRLLQEGRPQAVGRVSSWELTARERDVLTCLRSPMTADEIAASMFLSVNTIKTHIRAIYRKLGADGRRSAVRTALQRGLL